MSTVNNDATEYLPSPLFRSNLNIIGEDYGVRHDYGPIDLLYVRHSVARGSLPPVSQCSCLTPIHKYRGVL